jgi:hypothetical protein
MQFDFMSHCHWFPVTAKNDDTDSSERISKGNQSRKYQDKLAQQKIVSSLQINIFKVVS